MKKYTPQNLGLFVIPIKMNNKTSTYNDYLDFVVQAEYSGYSHVYIGEHLTDPYEDIQSSLIFASALLARTKRIKVCLSVLPLPHYHIRLLIKQLEDLARLSCGRLLVGFSQGALDSDLVFLGLDPSRRQELFMNNLNEFIDGFRSSIILRDLYPHSLFSTLLSTFPAKSAALFESGFGALSSNFCHTSHLGNHIMCLKKSNDYTKALKSKPFWNVGINLAPLSTVSSSSRKTIRNSLIYIYSKLAACGLQNVMTGRAPDSNIQENNDTLGAYLEAVSVFASIPPETRALIESNSDCFGHFVVNLFDCIDDACYNDFILTLPAKGVFCGSK